MSFRLVSLLSILVFLSSGALAALILLVAPHVASGRELLYITLPREDQTATLYIHDLRHDLRFALRDDLLGWGIDAAWSPDGTRIAYTRFHPTVVRRDVYVFDLKTGATQQITQEMGDFNTPAWSPDGRYLAYQGILPVPRANWDLYLYDFLTGENRVLHAGLDTDGRPDWSPDGQWLAFETEKSAYDNVDVYRLNVETGLFRPLVASYHADMMPVWSPDGAWLAYVSWGTTSYDVFIASSDGRAPHPLFADSTDDLDPAWSPDSRLIAFSTRREADSYFQHIYVVSAAGDGEARRVTWGNEGYTQPHWRP